jgi:murein DD-endopeptidase MepM/ murein hydrolase activator NlpD
MNMLQLYYPVKDKINPTNPFGAVNPMYSALKQKGHPGLDFESKSGTPVYAPCDGLAMYVTDQQHGDGIWIELTSEGQNYAIILWHLWPRGNAEYPFQIPTITGVKTPVKAGQLLAYSDNSGAPLESTGPHLHVGVLPFLPDWSAPVDPTNGYLGCVDPAPFFNGKFAQDISKEEKIVSLASEAVQEVVATPSLTSPEKVQILQQIVNFLKGLF